MPNRFQAPASSSKDKDSLPAMPTALLLPAEISEINSLDHKAHEAAWISLRSPHLIALSSIALSDAMRVSRNSLLNALIARGIYSLAREQNIPLDLSQFEPYLDPTTEVPSLPKKRKTQS